MSRGFHSAWWQGTAAERGAFPTALLAVPFFWYETDTRDTYQWDGVAWLSTDVGGSGAANQVAYWTGASVLAGDAGMTYVPATDTLTVVNVVVSGLGAGAVQSSAAGVISSGALPLTDLASYAQGSIIRGGAADWEAYAHPGLAGRALISDVTDIIWTVTPTWMGAHTFKQGISLTGASGINIVTIKGNAAQGLHVVDGLLGGACQYLTFDTTTGAQVVVFNESGCDLDFRIEAVGIPGAFKVDGASGAIGIHHAPNAVVGIWLDVAASDGFDYAMLGRMTADSAGADAAVYYGYLGGIEITGAGNLTHITGQSALFGQIRHHSASAVTMATALGAEIRFQGAGATGSMATGRGLWIRNPINSGGAAGSMTTFQGIYIAALTFATNNYPIYSAGGNSYHAGRFAFGGTVAALAQGHFDQSSATAAIPVLILDQADLSEDMIEFISTIGVGNAIEAVGGKTLTTTHFIKVTLPGALTRYIPVGTIA